MDKFINTIKFEEFGSFLGFQHVFIILFAVITGPIIRKS
jgi:hypothetical protein